MFQTNVVEKLKISTLNTTGCPLPRSNRAIDEVMSKNIVEPDRLQMTITRMRIACWISKTTNTYSENETLIAFQLQQRLYKHASLLRHTYIAYLVNLGLKKLNIEITEECNDMTKKPGYDFIVTGTLN
jgi:phage-related protein